MRHLIILLMFSYSMSSLADGVLVYMPTTQPAGKIEKQVKAATSQNVTVFAKYSDFEAGLEATKHDFLISSEAFEMVGDDYVKGPDVAVGGAGKTKYILLSLDASWKTKNIADARVGAVEVIKRAKMKDFMDKIFGKPFKGIKTVSKAEDLFPLLVFKTVDVIAVMPYFYEELKEKFNTTVHEVGTSQEVSVLNVYSKKGKEADPEVEKLKTFDYKAK